MGIRNTEDQPDPVAMHAQSDPELIGVAVRVWVTADLTFTEIWQQGPGLPAGGVLVSSRRYARRSGEAVSVRRLAGHLVDVVKVQELQGWPELR